jgi:DUF1680 family protein
MDWYGEHGGKWLYTAALAVKQGGDKNLEALLIKTADYLVGTQDPDGYLGVYSPAIRVTNDQANHKRSWDVWNLSYMTLGLLQVNRYYPKPEYLGAAKKIGELFLREFGDGSRNITDYGTRRGTSATVILDPIVELYKTTRDARYLNLAETIVKELEAKDEHKLITAGKNNVDAEMIGDGKAYQVIWNLTGVVKLYAVTGNVDYMKAATNVWQNIKDYHLNITGGPWGGVGKHLECFNRKNFWSPYGFVETCSTMSWIQLNKEMLRLTGEAKYAQEIEKSAYNSLLGARFPNGTDWTYHSFNNGSWHMANFNDCCPSSGAMALEELPSVIYSRLPNGVAVNLYTASEANLKLGSGNAVHIVQKTNYPFDGKITLTVSPSKAEAFAVNLRIPEWATSAAATIKVNGKPFETTSLRPGEYFTLNRTWKVNDQVELELPFDLRIEQKIEQVDAPQNAGEIYNASWFSLSRGPLVYAANSLIDGKDRERTLTLSSVKAADLFTSTTSPQGMAGPAYVLKAEGIQQPLVFVPYYEAGGMKQGGWRLTWLQNKID